ncbi:hypothetical protein WJX81_001733 [Elliptochloris bilobata]|uniref:Putative gamma-glutamylcyclotransferase n=1 Tax=Elliptochloris bilobata TaxID=381761 RepID=A0AAW1S0V7_9CHLO
MAPEVLQVLLKRVPRSQPARVQGYFRHRIRGHIFPGAQPAGPEDEVSGLVLHDLSAQELDVFDAFEGDEYYKVNVRPQLSDATSVDAFMYVWHERRLLYGEWDFEEWRRKHLTDYTLMCGEFIEEIGGVGSAVQRSATTPAEPQAF